MDEKRKHTSETEQQEKKFKCLTYFNDLPNELLLMICHYLSPANVIKAFFHYNERISTCISKYHQTIDLTKWLYSDLTFFLSIYKDNYLEPSTLIVSNAKICQQIKLFIKICYSSEFNPRHVHHLSLLECVQEDFFGINSCLQKFKSLQSLRIIQSIFDEKKESTRFLIDIDFYNFIFKYSLNTLIDLELIIHNGIILSKQLHSNKYLKRLIISVHDINDLYVLLDGLVPNLISLNVTIYQSSTYKQLSLPKNWPYKCMCYLLEFHLTINDNVAFNFNQLRYTVMPLIELNKLTLNIKQWLDNDQEDFQNKQIGLLFEQYLPKLKHFCCSIQTIVDINIQNWPMKCHQNSNNLQKHFYTIPWSFEHLHTSMLADDDTTNICLNVQHLTVDVPCSNLSYRFPNIQTLHIYPDCHLSPENFIGFRQLHYLTMNNINIVPSSIIRRIHTLTLFETNDILNHSFIYLNVQHLIIKNHKIGSSIILKSLSTHFPYLRSIEIQLQSNSEYYDNINIFLNREYFTDLSLIKTNSLDEYRYCSNIQLWILEKTSLKWYSNSFYVHCDANNLIISL